jgi:hypothetical protein
MSDKLIIATFQYMMLRLAEKFVGNVEEFQDRYSTSSLQEKYTYFNNLTNNYNQIKCNLFVYIICTGNGKREELIKFFQGVDETLEVKYNFYPDSENGIYNDFIKEYIKENLPSNTSENVDLNSMFSIPENGSMKIKVELFKDISDSNTFEELKEELCKRYASSHDEKESLKIYLGYVDRSIKYIHENVYKRFANFTISWMKKHNEDNILYNEYKSKWSSIGEEEKKVFNLKAQKSSSEFSPS